MKVYYKGWLMKSEESNDTFKLTVKSPIEHYRTISNEKLHLNKLDYEYYSNNIEDYHKEYDGIKDLKLIEILKKIPNLAIKNFPDPTQIFFEIVKDKDGKEYGKELITGLLFPLRKKVNTEDFFYGTNDAWIIEVVKTYKDENIARFKYILEITEVASMNDVKSYLDMKNNQKNLTMHKNNIKFIYDENVFKNEIVLKEEEPLEKQSEVTKIMQDIEFILNLLDQYNHELYIKHLDEYNKLCNENNDTQNYCTPNKKDYSNLLSNIKLSLLASKENCNNISEYLNVITENYLNKILDDNISVNDIDIKDIENFNDMFLKNKKKYTIQIQREVLKKLSLLYLLVIKNNIDNISESQLEQSYFKDNMKSVILHIDNLLKLEILKGNIQIDYSKEPNTKEVLDMIKNIEFNKKQNIKKLIK